MGDTFLMSAAIQVSQLRKVYNGVAAVDGVSFDIAEGEVFGLLGPNGAGKTTTVECIEGLRIPDSGSILLLGKTHAAHGKQLKEKIGVQLQSTGLFPQLTVYELLRLFASFYAHTLKIDEVIGLVGLEEKRNTASKNLSGGQQQRLSLALALINDPILIFMDEPTTGLDPQARRQIWDIITNLKRMGKTVLLTTHYMEEAQTLCDRVAVIDHGRIIALDAPSALIAQHFETTAIEFDADSGLSAQHLEPLPAVKRVMQDGEHFTVFSASVPQTIEVLLRLSGSGQIQMEDLRVRSASLEDVFLKLTGRKIRD